MLEEKDLQSIGKLLDKKLDEVISSVNDGFTGVQRELDIIKEDVKLRPTLQQIMNWGDKKIVALELDVDKVKYLHLKEFKNLPSQPEISRVLVEHDLKSKNKPHPKI